MGSVSIADMERVALGGNNLRFSEDIGNVIEIGDLSDDLGLSMLMNPSKVSGSSSGQGQGPSVSFNERPSNANANANANAWGEEKKVNISPFGGQGMQQGQSQLGGIDITPLEPLEPISIDAHPIDMNNFGGPPIEVNVNKEYNSGLFGNNQSATGPGVSLASPARDPEAEKKEKGDYINKLNRLEQKGFPVSRKFTMDNSLEEIKTEYFRLVDARQLETSIKFQRQMLMGAITGMEWLNGRFDPFDLKLDGWSESAHENIEDFDEIFEELYDKYKDRGKMSPEMRLVMAVGGSGFMCHVSNSFFRSKMPSMDDVLRKNPELARQMAAAAAQQAGPGFGNFMGMAMGVPVGPIPSGPSPSGPPNFQGPDSSYSPSVPVAPSGAFFTASAASPPSSYGQQPPQPPNANAKPTARREMAGPSGVDDILRTFEEVRRSELTANPQSINGYATQPAVAAASVVSADEMRSHAESVQTNATGRRRRRAAAPVGNTIALNV